MKPQQAPARSDGSDLPSFTLLMRKGGPQANADPYWIDRWFFRPWTAYLSWVFVKLRLSANAVTLLSAVVLIGGAGLLSIRSVGTRSAVLQLIGAGLVVLYAALDCCDGEVARYYRLTGKSTGGRDGAYWDDLVHGLEPVLVAALAWRLYLDSHMDIWPLVVAVVDAAALCMAPWQRCCEILVAWIRDQQQSANVERIRDVALTANGQEHSKSDLSRTQQVFAAVKQLLLFPGYFMTLPVAVILDVAIGPIAVGTRLTESGPEPIQLYWVALWLLQHAGGKVLAVARSARRYAQRLHKLPD